MRSGKSNLTAWLVFLLAAGFLFYKYLVFVIPAIITGPLMQHYSLSATSLGFGVSLYFYSYLLMQIPAGMLIDRYGIRIWTSLAILSCALGVLLFGLAPTWLLACLGRLLIGFGAAFAITAYMKLMSVYFPTDYFPFMASFFGIACMAGAGTAEMPLAWLLVKFKFETTLYICSGIGVVWALLFCLVVKKDKREEKRAQHPAKEHSFSWRKARDVLKQPANLALILYTGLAFTPLTVFAGLWGIPFVMVTYHFTILPAASIVSFSFFGFVVGGLFGDPLSKKIKSKRILLFIGTLLSLGLLSLVIYGPHLSEWLLTSIMFLFGFFSSIYLVSYALAQNFNPPKEMSTAIVLINMIGPFLSLIAEPLIGKVLDLKWQNALHGYQIGLSMLTGCLFLALLCCLFIKERNHL